MAIVTAAAVRAKYSREALVDLPDRSGQVRCRIPDFATQVFEGLLPQPLVLRVVRDLRGQANDEPSTRELTPAEVLERTQDSREFTNRWICLVCLEPRVVMTREEVTDDTVCVEDLPHTLKNAIIEATLQLAGGTAAAEEFRRDELDGAADRPVVPAVAGDAAVVRAGD